MLASQMVNSTERFYKLASIWINLGATQVQLLDKDRVLVSIPEEFTTSIPMLKVESRVSNLALRISGLTGDAWGSIAESMLDGLGSLLTIETEMKDLTAALVETQDRLVAIYELTQATRRTLDIPALMELLVKETKSLFDADGGLVILKEKGQQPIFHQLSDQHLSQSELEALATLFHNDQNRYVINDPLLLPPGIHNLMMLSLPVRDKVCAMFGVYNSNTDFTSPDIKLAQAIAGQLGAQFENTYLHLESLSRVRLEAELDIARQVQMNILPQSVPIIEGLDIFAMSAPAFEVGGDFFDVIERSKDSLVLTVGDVTGKGMPSALLMSMTHTVIKSASRMMPFNFPHQVLDRLNFDLFADFSNVGMFATVFFGTFDRTNSVLSFSNAGQSPIYHIPHGQEPVLLEAQDIPVGVLIEYGFTSQNINFSHGDIFVIATDGFPEARNAVDEMFGYERMKNSLSKSRNRSAKEMVESLLADVNSFSASNLKEDDQTILVVKVIDKDRTKQFIIPATYEDIRIPAEYMRRLLVKSGLADSIINNCELAMQEHLTNLVEHAYVGKSDNLITVNIACDDDQVLIETVDTGEPVDIDLSKVKMPDPMDLAEGGYGLAIIQSLMDQVTYNTNNGRNTWQLIKFIHRAP
jgi:sigma-B regulation protein RsbU (phosphoserine phosphatase)